MISSSPTCRGETFSLSRRPSSVVRPRPVCLPGLVNIDGLGFSAGLQQQVCLQPSRDLVENSRIKKTSNVLVGLGWSRTQIGSINRFYKTDHL